MDKRSDRNMLWITLKSKERNGQKLNMFTTSRVLRIIKWKNLETVGHKKLRTAHPQRGSFSVMQWILRPSNVFKPSVKTALYNSPRLTAFSLPEHQIIYCVNVVKKSLKLADSERIPLSKQNRYTEELT
ncbi:hypothetical protein DICVIV_04051 [Dictyocaulus viviparus]|uniref:Uncharacterized protein n=1 Tax=Dictyocaulus viviparus TaxID=29172 RepID=A0A0D8XYT8_DICVI|nr:hypothetical protein DICVIV_04051 [Dictyocaulus viviparus]